MLSKIKLSRIKNIIFIITILFTFFYILLNNKCLAATPKIVTKLNDAFENIEKWLLKISTPAAAVAIAVGLFMKKFSLGAEERIRIAKKIIRGSFFSYIMLLSLDLILAAIKSLI